MSYDHYDHRSEFCNINEEVAKREMESLLTYLAESKRSVSSLEDAIEKCKKTMQLVESKKKEVDAEIGNSLEKVCTALLEQNEELRSTKITNLEEQVQELQQLRDGLSHTADMIKSAQSYSPAQQLAIKKTLEERAKGLQREFEGSGPRRHPSESDVFVTAIVNADTVAKVIGLGKVWGERSEAASSTCDVDDMPRALAGKSHIFTVTARDTSGNLCGYGNKVAAKLVLNGFPALNGEVTDRGRGSYSVTLTPETPGKYDLHVTIGEGHIKGSPFEYHVAQPRKTAYTELYAQQHITTNLKPHDVAVTEEGQLAVAELGTHTVTLYSVTGERKYSFGTADNQGNADGQFNAPSAVAIRGDIMYVAEKGNNRVQKFSISQRRFISKFGSRGNGPGQFSEIYGICIDSKGRVFVTDWGNQRVQVFNDDDSYSYAFYCQKKPWGLAFDLQGRLHVSSYSPNLIDVFTPKGPWLPVMVAAHSATRQALPSTLRAMLPSVSASGESAVSSIYMARTNPLFTHSRSSSVVVEGWPVTRKDLSGWLTLAIIASQSSSLT